MDFDGHGQLPPVVLLHGLSSSAADYYPLIRCLQSQHSRVVALDLPVNPIVYVNLYTTLYIHWVYQYSLYLYPGSWIHNRESLSICQIIRATYGTIRICLSRSS